MKKLIVGLLLLCVTWAVEADDSVKIGVVDIQRIMQTSPEVRSISEKLQNQFKPREDKLKAQEQAIEDLVNKLKRNSAVMTAAQIEAQKSQIDDKRNDLQAAQAQFMQEARAAQEKDLGGIIEKINAAVEQIAKREHYTLIVQRDHVVYYQPNMDITSEVLATME